jgi:hypothetical protein
MRIAIHPETFARRLATFGEGAAMALFLIMLAVWCGIGSGRI